MNEPKLKVTVELAGQEKIEEFLGKLSKKYNLAAEADYSNIAGEIQKNIATPMNKQISAFNRFKKSAQEFGLVMFGVSSAIRGAMRLYDATVRAVVDSAAEFEQLKLRLVSLYQDTDKAASAFEKFRMIAAKTPASLKEVVEAGASLKAFGLEAEDVLESVADLAAYMGLDIVEAAQAVGRAFAGGVGAADVLRERGVLELIKSFKGIEDLTKLSLPQFREAMLSTFSDASAGIAGSSERMAKSYTGAVSNMKDAMENLRATIGERLTPVLGGAANVLAKFANNLSGTKTGLDAVKESLMGQRIEFERLILIYKELHFNQNRSKEENEKYQKTINELLTKYPNYLGKIDLEKSAWKDIAEAIELSRSQLQEWINLKIKQAIIESKEAEYVSIYAELNKVENELKTLQAEFIAGTKSRTERWKVDIAHVRKLVYDEEGNARMESKPMGKIPEDVKHDEEGKYYYREVSTMESFNERKLQEKIKENEAEIKALNKDIDQMVALIAGEEVVAPSNEEKGKNKGSEGGGGSGKQSEIDKLMSEIEEYRILRKANFDEEQAEIGKLRRDYAEKLKMVAGNADAESILQEKRDREIIEIQKKYQEKREAEEAAHYEKLKFFAEGYYEWKITQIEKEAEKTGASEAWKQEQIAQLNQERAEWDKRAIKAFEEKYSTEMSHLAELRELGLASYAEVANKAWEYYDALVAIVEADGIITEAEKELLAMYRKRSQAAQLAVNRDSDIAAYYEEIRFLDSSYYDWKKARIEEDVHSMDISEEQKAALIKAKLEELKLGMQDSMPDKSFFNNLLDTFAIPIEYQTKIISSFQSLANQISSIWSQLYSNLTSNRDQSLKDLEERAKKERKSEAWLAKEKERINAEYEKKYRTLKRTEQKMQIASATVNTLEGITNALTIKPAWLAPIMAASIGALGFAQVKLIAEQKFASGGHIRGKGSSTSDSNIIAVSDNEYIISANRVNRFGVPFFDALNYGNAEQIRKALSSIRIPSPSISYPSPQSGYASGGLVRPQAPIPMDMAMNVILKCDGKALAKAVIKGKKKIIST